MQETASRHFMRIARQSKFLGPYIIGTVVHMDCGSLDQCVLHMFMLLQVYSTVDWFGESCGMHMRRFILLCYDHTEMIVLMLGQLE